MARSLKSLHLKGYRAFSDFRVTDLGRVNLIVGKNNAGKTSILEAIRLLASGGDPSTLSQIATDRGETVAIDPELIPEYRREAAAPDISHFFHGHQFGPGLKFDISSGNGLGSLTAEIVEMPQLPDDERIYIGRESSLFSEGFYEGQLALRLRSEVSDSYGIHAFAVSEEGAFIFDASTLARVRPTRRRPKTETVPTVVITPSSLLPSLMSGMWERVIREGRETDAIEALRILQPDIDGIFFLPGERVMRGRGGVLVSQKGSKRRVPLGSMGEGMRRILALAISLAQSRRGFLIVDEIDTGLHWSVMAKMWALVMRTARDLNVQVFATTHSLDCLRGLKDAVDDHADLKKNVRVHKVDTALNEAITFSADDLSIAIDQEIEVRG
jgi:energy-coupling factor transporter ATP-binding protein EcfA2